MNLLTIILMALIKKNQILISLLGRVADKDLSKVRSQWNMAYLFFYEGSKDRIFEIPNCFDG